MIDESRCEQLLFQCEPVALDLARPEDVWHGDADGDAGDDGRGFDAVSKGGEQEVGADLVDVQEREEEAVEQDAGNQRDGGGNRQHDVWCVESVDGKEREDADEGGAEEGACRLAHAEFEHADISEEDRDDAAGGDDPEQAARHAEDHGEAASGDGGGERMVDVDLAGTQVHLDERADMPETQGDRHAECCAADDEERVERPRHARCDEVVQEVVRRVDERHAGHDEEGAGDNGQHGRRRQIELLQQHGGKRRGKGRDGNAGVGVEAVLVAEAPRIEAEEGGGGCDEEGGEVAAEEGA